MQIIAKTLEVGQNYPAHLAQELALFSAETEKVLMISIDGSY